MSAERRPPKPDERRVAPRVDAHGLHLDLARATTRSGTRAIETVPCFVRDLSITGARIVVPRSFQCAVGTLLVLSLGGHTGAARVVRLVLAGRRMELAIEFRRLTTELRAVIDDVVRGETHHLDAEWRVAG